MRYFVKITLITILVIVLLWYYGLFGFDYGFSQSINSISPYEIISVRDVRMIEFGSDNVFITFTTMGGRYYGTADSDSAIVLAVLGAVTHMYNVQDLHLYPLILGCIGILFIMFFPRTKKQKERARAKKLARQQAVLGVSDGGSSDDNKEEDESTTDESEKDSIENYDSDTEVVEVNEVPQKKKKHHPFLIAFGIVAGIALLIFIIVVIVRAVNHDSSNYRPDNNDKTSSYYQPDLSLNTYDFDLEITYEFITWNYEITPSVDVDYVNFRLSFFDDKGKEVYRQSFNLHDLSAYETYTGEINIPFLDKFSLETYRFQVIDGKRKYYSYYDLAKQNPALVYSTYDFEKYFYLNRNYWLLNTLQEWWLVVVTLFFWKFICSCFQ